MKWMVPLIITLLAGCAFTPPLSPLLPLSPLPTPTTMTATLLPVEGVLRGNVCRELTTEVQVFLLSSEQEWQDLLAQSLANHRVPDFYLSEISGQTDFQTHRLLLALRTCHSNSFHTISIDRVVSVANRLYVYVELGDPAPGSYLDTMADGGFHLVRIPWPEASPDHPTVEVVPYQIQFMVGAPVP